MSDNVHIKLTINGNAHEADIDPRTLLVEAVRDTFGYKGTHIGCLTGDCGACSVLIDGRLVPSCLMLAAEATGHNITTIEGISSGDKLHPIQQKFLEHAALQCGVCTPGFIVAAKALLDKNPDPTEEQVRFWLAGNLCRCTGYDKIIRAVLEAAAEMRRVVA